MTNNFARAFATVGLGLWALGQPASAEGQNVLRIGGTGMAMAAMEQLGQQFAVTDPALRVEVLPSLGSPGGIKALGERAIDIAVVGRHLNEKERADALVEANCYVTPLLFVTSHPAPASIAKADLPGLYARPNPTWPDGTPLKIVLRSRAGSENGYLTAAIQGMAAALEAAYKFPGIPVATVDQENADVASRISGSFAIMTLLQLRAERLNLQVVPLDGVAPTPESVADGTYPLSAQVCVVIPRSPGSIVARFVDYVRSAPSQALMRSLGAISSQ